MNETTPLDPDIFESWLANDQGPVALVLKQRLLPVEGEGGVIHPPTYADIGYSIDTLSDGARVALIDSVPSQANRMEPLFGDEAYRHLVPQIDFDLGKHKDDRSERRVSLLELAHRAGDAVVRASGLALDMDQAFKALARRHDAEPLARLAPTSLVFGAWDSRGSQVKRPRLIRAFIRAENIEVLHGAAQYNSIWKLLDEEQRKALKDEAKAKRIKLSDKGFNDVPAVFRKSERTPKYARDGSVNPEARVLGGVIARGPITRHVTLNLIALRTLHGGSEAGTLALRRYLLGLCLVAATAEPDLYLREGCLLRLADGEAESWELVNRRGPGGFLPLSNDEGRRAMLTYASQAAEAFGIDSTPMTYAFDIQLAKALLAKSEEQDTDAEI